MDFDVQPSEDVQEKSYLTQLREALDVVNEKLLQNREKQRLLWECDWWERTYVSPDLLLPWFQDSFQNSPNLNVCDKKPVFHQLKKFSREEVQHLKSGIAGLWALQKLSNGANTSSIHHEIKQENEMPWDEVAQILPDRTTTEVKLKWLNELDPRLLRNAWTTDELHKLESAVKKYNQREWIKVAKEVSRRTPLQAYQKWQERHRKELLNVDWSIDEDNKMRELVYKHGEREWKLIASEMPKRSPEQLLHRWTRTSNPNIVHGRWDPEDDFKLIVMMRYLTGDHPIDKKDKTQIWCTAASIFPHKTDRKVRERWCNVIDCEKKEFTTQIDKKIMGFVKNKFNGTCRGSEIAKILNTGHTGAQINRRFKKLNKAYQKRTRNEKRVAQIQGLRTEKRQGGAKSAEVIFNELTESDYGDSDDEYVPPEVSHSLRKKPRAPRKRPRSDSLLVKTEEEPNAKRFCKTPEKPSASEKAKESSSNVPCPISPDLNDLHPRRNVVQPSHVTPAPGESAEPSLM